MGFEILATAGTAEVLRRNGVTASLVRKHYEGDGADGERTVVGRIHDGEVALVVNTPHGTTSGGSPRLAGYEIRAADILTDIPCNTTFPGLGAAVQSTQSTDERRVGKEWLVRSNERGC